MKKREIFCGNKISTKAVRLGGVLFCDDDIIDSKEIIVVMGGFSRVATREKLLLTIAEKSDKPCFVFDWHGLGMSGGDFGNVTVEGLANDLKRVIGMLFSEGFSKFHLVGHSLGACVIALFTDRYDKVFSIGKKIFISPALDQSFLLRCWFAKEKGLELCIPSWKERYEENCSLFQERRIRRECDFGKCWDHEEKFQEYIHAEKVIKGIYFTPNYWEMESPMNYLYYLAGYDHGFFGVLDDDILFIFGNQDSAVPFSSIDFNAVCRAIFHADHYLGGQEDGVSEIVNDFIHK